jgi:hypothetical protein
VEDLREIAPPGSPESADILARMTETYDPADTSGGHGRHRRAEPDLDQAPARAAESRGRSRRGAVMNDAAWWARVIQARTERDDLRPQRVWTLHKAEHAAAIELKAVPGQNRWRRRQQAV